MEMAVCFHEKVTKTRKGKDGEIICTVSPLPIRYWDCYKDVRLYQHILMGGNKYVLSFICR